MGAMGAMGTAGTLANQTNGLHGQGTALWLGNDAPTLPILLIDDNEVNLIVTEALLRELGYEVDVARNAEVALEKFRCARFGLMLMDVQMPGMDGLAATREIRRIEAAEGRERTPIVALTANAFDTDERSSLDAGCDAHLTKPVNRQRLIDTVVALGQHLPEPIDVTAAAGEVQAANASAHGSNQPPVAGQPKISEAELPFAALTDAAARGRLH